jgi:hypothetical protein
VSRKLTVVIAGDSSSLEHALHRAGIQADGFGSKLGHVAKMAGLALGAGAVGGLALVLDKSVKAAMAGQASQAALDTALKATQQSVTKMTPALDAAEAASRKLGFADDESRAALARLELASKNTKSAISDLSVAEGIARIKHVDLAAAAGMLVQAHTGSQRAAKALGVVIQPLTDHFDTLKEKYKELGEQIPIAEAAQAKYQDKLATGQSIIDAVTEKVKGQSEAFAGTAAGGMAEFQAQLTHVEEELGNKLLPAMTHVLEWVNAHWPQISAVVERVSAAVGVAIEGARIYLTKYFQIIGDVVAYVQQNWPKISATVTQVMETVRSIITQVTTVAQAIWAKFGATITAIARIYFGAVVTYIVAEFRVIQGIFQLIGDVLHGRWSKVWDDIKQIVSNALIMLTTMIKTYIQIAYTLALAIGKALVGGVIDGLKNLGQALGDAMGSGIRKGIDAVKSLHKILSPSGVTRDEIGIPLGQGIVEGFTSSTDSLGSLMMAQLKKAVDSAKAIIASAQSDFQTQFQSFQSIADQMFSGIAGASQTAAGKKLAALTGKHDAAQLTGAITTARGDLGTAQEGGDPAQILAAQQALDDALYNQKVANLQKEATLEQTDLDARNQVKQIAFDTALGKLEKHLTDSGASTDTAMKAITKLLRSYGVTFGTVGTEMGDAWVGGLRSAIESAAKGSSTLRKVIGSQSDQLGGLLGGIPQAATGGYVAAGGLAVIHSGETIVPAGGGGRVENHFHFPSYLGNTSDVERWMIEALRRANRRGVLPEFAT